MDKAAIMATTGQVKTMGDGSLRISIEIMPAQAKAAFALFGAPGTPVALACITQAAAVTDMRKSLDSTKPAGTESAPEGYGRAYSALYRSGFWFIPALHEALDIEQSVAALRSRENGDAKEIIELVKGRIYSRLGIGSMAELDPAEFRSWLGDMLNLERLLPKDFP